MANNARGSLKAGNEGISSTNLNRNVKTVRVYIHELLDIKKNIKKGAPINWGLHTFWSLFCLCFGSVISDAMTKNDFSIAYFKQVSPFLQVILGISFLGSLLLLFLSKSQSSAEDSINQILEQCNYEKEEADQ